MFRRNPVYQKEVGTDARAARVFSMIIIFNCVLSVVMFVMFYSTLNGISSMGAFNYSGLVELYTLMAYIEFGIVFLVIPVITAGTITGERERRTLDIMLVGSRYVGTVIIGKFMACMQLVLVVIISSIPVLSIVFVYGGIRFINLIQLLGIIFVSGIYIGSIGIFCSSLCKKTTSAIVIAYAVITGVILVTTGLNYFIANINVDGNYIGNYYVMSLNPIALITHLISEQLETVNEFEKLIFPGVSKDISDMIAKKWLLYSSIIQVLVSIILLNVSALVLNPLKFNYLRRLIRKNVNRKKIAKN